MRHAAEHLLRQGVRSLAVIHFPEGAGAFSRNWEFFSEPSRRLEPSRIVDATGAGDAFAAGVIYALHEDMSLREALKLGNLTACFNLLSPGASGGAISLAEMRKKG